MCFQEASRDWDLHVKNRPAGERRERTWFKSSRDRKTPALIPNMKRPEATSKVMRTLHSRGSEFQVQGFCWELGCRVQREEFGMVDLSSTSLISRRLPSFMKSMWFEPTCSRERARKKERERELALV